MLQGVKRLGGTACGARRCTRHPQSGIRVILASRSFSPTCGSKALGAAWSQHEGGELAPGSSSGEAELRPRRLEESTERLARGHAAHF